MARPDADEEDKPLDPAVENVRRKLIRFMAVNLGLLFLAVMVVLAAIVYKSRSRAPAETVAASGIPTPAGAAQTGDIVLPAGARVVSQSLSGNRLAIDAELTDGSRAIFVYDMAAQRLVGRYAIRNR